MRKVAPPVTDSSPLITDHDWRARAACADHDPTLWDMDRATRADARRARAICAGCPVLADCARAMPKDLGGLMWATRTDRPEPGRAARATPDIDRPEPVRHRAPDGSSRWEHQCLRCGRRFLARAARAKHCEPCRPAARAEAAQLKRQADRGCAGRASHRSTDHAPT